MANSLPRELIVQKPIKLGGREFAPGQPVKWMDHGLIPLKVMQLIKYRYFIDPFGKVPKIEKPKSKSQIKRLKVQKGGKKSDKRNSEVSGGVRSESREGDNA